MLCSAETGACMQCYESQGVSQDGGGLRMGTEIAAGLVTSDQPLDEITDKAIECMVPSGAGFCATCFDFFCRSALALFFWAFGILSIDLYLAARRLRAGRGNGFPARHRKSG